MPYTTTTATNSGSRLILLSLLGATDVEALRVQILELDAGLVVDLGTAIGCGAGTAWLQVH